MIRQQIFLHNILFLETISDVNIAYTVHASIQTTYNNNNNNNNNQKGTAATFSTVKKTYRNWTHTYFISQSPHIVVTTQIKEVHVGSRAAAVRTAILTGWTSRGRSDLRAGVELWGDVCRTGPCFQHETQNNGTGNQNWMVIYGEELTHTHTHGMRSRTRGHTSDWSDRAVWIVLDSGEAK